MGNSYIRTANKKICKEYDVLVLGAGLSGLRAALEALRENPDLNLLVVNAKKGPSGSSFANLNNALGMQVLDTRKEKDAFEAKVLEIASPGFVDPRLVSILAEESFDRFREMVRLGLEFDFDFNGDFKRFPACFAPELKTARVFRRLSHAYSCFKVRLLDLNCNFLEGYAVKEILVNGNESPGRAQGALLENSESGNLIRTEAAAVIVALGGPAASFRHNLALSKAGVNPYLMLERAGVKLENTEFVQFMWSDLPKRKFVSAADLVRADAKVRLADGKVIDFPRHLKDLAQLRATHCPMAYGMKDRAIDDFLLECRGAGGSVEVFCPERGRLKIAAMAHAGNGGAVIDEYGRTNVPGLYCVGECATGMHGANRLGGAMILATQVFGRRAGLAAGGMCRGPLEERQSPRSDALPGK